MSVMSDEYNIKNHVSFHCFSFFFDAFWITQNWNWKKNKMLLICWIICWVYFLKKFLKFFEKNKKQSIFTKEFPIMVKRRNLPNFLFFIWKNNDFLSEILTFIIIVKIVFIPLTINFDIPMITMKTNNFNWFIFNWKNCILWQKSFICYFRWANCS